MVFRYLFTILGALRRPRVPLLEAIATLHRCWPTDCDVNIHMNDGRYVSVSGLSRVALMMRIGLFPFFKDRGWRPIASAVDVRYFREIRPFARFSIRTRIASWDEKYFYFEHLFELASKTPVPATRILVRSLFRGPSGPIPTAEVLAALGFTGEQPEASEELRHWIALADLVRKRKG